MTATQGTSYTQDIFPPASFCPNSALAAPYIRLPTLPFSDSASLRGCLALCRLKSCSPIPVWLEPRAFHTCAHMSMHALTCKCIPTCTAHMHAHMYRHIHVHTCTKERVYIHAEVHTNIHTCTHICTHKHTCGRCSALSHSCSVGFGCLATGSWGFPFFLFLHLYLFF